MKKLFVSGLAIAIYIAPLQVLAAEKYRGKWNGSAGTTLTIKSGSPLSVQYCFRNECSSHNPSGSVDNMTILFPARNNFPGATMTMKKSGDSYLGRYQVKGAPKISTATLKKSAF